MRQTLHASEISQGLYSIFRSAGIYDAFQRLIGANRARTFFIKQFVVPFPGAKVLDIGCGTGAMLECLPESVEYVGFDLNPNYISYAQRRYGRRGSFFCDRVSTASAIQGGPFDFVLGFGILHHLTDQESRTLFELAYDSLKPSGTIVTYDSVFVEYQSRIARYIISKDRGRHVRTPAKYIALAKTAFTDIDGHVSHDLLRMPYSHFIMKCYRVPRR